MQVTGPVFSRIFNRPGSGYAEKLKHSIEPFLNIERISPIDDFNQYVQLDGTDTIVGRSTRLSYGVANRFFRKAGGGGRSQELLTASLGQSYYSDANAAIYDKNYQTANGTAPSHFSPLSLQVRVDADRPDHGAVPRGVRHEVHGDPHDVGRRHGEHRATGFTPRPAGASGASSRACRGSTTRRGWTTT